MIEKIANQYSDSATHFTWKLDALLNCLLSTNIIFVKNVFTTKEKCSRNVKQFTYKYIMNICYANFDMHIHIHIYIYHFIIYDSTL